MSIPFDIEERTEDAFVQLLRARVGTNGGLIFYAANDGTVLTFPSAGVLAADTGPVSEGAEWHFPRVVQVQIAVATERAAEQDSTGQTLRTARQRNQDARSLVMNALTRFDAGDIVDDAIVTGVRRRSLLGQLLDQGIAGVAFSQAQILSVTRTIEEDKNKLVTNIMAEVIAEPVELNP
jgi:hypothetical protein